MLFKQFLLVQTTKNELHMISLFDLNKHKEFENRELLCETKVKLSYENSSSRINNYPNHLL